MTITTGPLARRFAILGALERRQHTLDSLASAVGASVASVRGHISRLSDEGLVVIDDEARPYTLHAVVGGRVLHIDQPRPRWGTHYERLIPLALRAMVDLDGATATTAARAMGVSRHSAYARLNAAITAGYATKRREKHRAVNGALRSTMIYRPTPEGLLYLAEMESEP